MKELVLHPKHKRAILTGKKVSTVQLGKKLAKKFKRGKRLRLSIGMTDWKERLAKAVITSVKVKRIGNLTKQDIASGNPKTKTRKDLIKALGFYYRKRLGRELGMDDVVTVIKWRYIES